MTPVRSNNFKSINDMFEDLFSNLSNFPVKENAPRVPPVNIYETEDAFRLELIAPGLQKEDFKINLEKGLLTISYEKKEAEKSGTYKIYKREYTPSNFRRSFVVDEKINADGIQARYETGILNLVFPKMEPVKPSPKTISIQ